MLDLTDAKPARKHVHTKPDLAAYMDIDNVMALGLAFHLNQDEPSRSTKDGKLAANMLVELANIKCETAADEAYLFGMKAVIVQIGDGLTDLVRRQRADLVEAEAWCSRATSKVRDGHVDAFWMNLIARTVMFGGIGFGVLASIAPEIQTHIHHDGPTQQFSLSVGAWGALVFAAASRVINAKLANMRDQRISNHYDWLRAYAQRKYFRGKHDLLKIGRDRAHVLWKTYTGRSAPEMTSLLAIAAEEMRAHEGAMRDRKKMTATLLQSAFNKISAWRRERDKARELKSHNQIIPDPTKG